MSRYNYSNSPDMPSHSEPLTDPGQHALGSSKAVLRRCHFWVEW